MDNKGTTRFLERREKKCFSQIIGDGIIYLSNNYSQINLNDFLDFLN